MDGVSLLECFAIECLAVRREELLGALKLFEVLIDR
jgi:hypothetical protein